MSRGIDIERIEKPLADDSLDAYVNDIDDNMYQLEVTHVIRLS